MKFYSVTYGMSVRTAIPACQAEIGDINHLVHKPFFTAKSPNRCWVLFNRSDFTDVGIRILSQRMLGTPESSAAGYSLDSFFFPITSQPTVFLCIDVILLWKLYFEDSPTYIYASLPLIWSPTYVAPPWNSPSSRKLPPTSPAHQSIHFWTLTHSNNKNNNNSDHLLSISYVPGPFWACSISHSILTITLQGTVIVWILQIRKLRLPEVM